MQNPHVLYTTTIITFMSSAARPVEGSVSSLIQPIDPNLVIDTFPQPAYIACLNTQINAVWQLIGRHIKYVFMVSFIVSRKRELY